SFYDGGNLIGMANLGALTGLAALNIGNFLPGSHDLTAVYPGDSRYLGSSTLAPYTQNVTINTSSVELTSDINPSQFGQGVTITPADADGMVDIVEGSTVIATVAVGFGGVATWQTSTMAVGNHVLHANYYGSSVYSTSSSPDLSQDVVGNTPPTVTVVMPNGG